MGEALRNAIKDGIGFALLLLFVFLFLFIEQLDFQDKLVISNDWLNVNTIFLSILLEALPFILIGVIVSSLIQTFVSEDLIQKLTPKNSIVAIVPVAILAAIFPVCECAIIPIVRRLIKKGMPLHLGTIFLVGAPILNPIVFASTYYAFQSNVMMAYGRMGLAFILSIVIGLVVFIIFKKSNQLKWTTGELLGTIRGDTKNGVNRFKATFYHASDEFFEVGKYLIIGAFIASMFQTFLDRNILLNLGSNETTAPLVMMGFAYVLSLCSEADAFVAASFGNTFSHGSILAFLVYGPIVDFKNTIMLFAFFKPKFVIGFLSIVTLVVYVAVLIYQNMFL
ncbi:permease [Pueribacillus theae]|uniref:Permease n=1 Tax=Pueribacillus theae TaxID=2171751 RepID=A0A2U1JSI4_9BACI|nr:permease [Pueribacillus theae]PWA08167.1 permease [Pueribacillus theae]